MLLCMWPYLYLARVHNIKLLPSRMMQFVHIHSEPKPWSYTMI